MADIKPFKAVRPTRDKVSLVASRSYLSYSEETLIEKLENNPYTFLHIINPDYSDKQTEVKGKAKYSLVKNKFNKFKAEGVFVQDQNQNSTSISNKRVKLFSQELFAPVVWMIT